MSASSDYFKAEGISRSELFYISKSPERFKYMHDNPLEPTNDMIIGSAFHKIVLEPDTYNNEFATAPEVDRRTKEGKAIFADFQERLTDEISVITQQDFDLISAMRDSLMKNELARTLLEGEREQPVFWDDNITGERCKCKPDVRTRVANKPIIIDVKTCQSADEEAFMRSCFKFGYDLQVGMYKTGCDIVYQEPHEFVFICIEKKPPYSVNILQVDDFFMKHGLFLFRKYLDIYHYCKTANDWYGYGGKDNMINSLSVPVWMATDI